MAQEFLSPLMPPEQPNYYMPGGAPASLPAFEPLQEYAPSTNTGYTPQSAGPSAMSRIGQFGTTAGAFMGNPLVMGGAMIIGTIGNIYDKVVARREAREERAAATRRYDQYLQTQERNYRDKMAQWQQSFNLTKQEAKHRMEKDLRDEARTNRNDLMKIGTDKVNRWLQSLQNPAGQGYFLQAMKGGR